jgi:acetyl esterase/lipase
MNKPALMPSRCVLVAILAIVGSFSMHTCIADSPAVAPQAQAAQDIPPTHVAVAYGPHQQQVVDLWQATSDGATPLVLFIHGGGWEGGGRKSVQTAGLRAFLESGISVASIDYRFVTPAIKAGITPPVQWPLGDAARALQFIRSRAKEWNIDIARIGAAGGSAGGCSSLWLALHDDMADPQSLDLVARQSTRLACAGVFDAQSSLDPADLRQWFKDPQYGPHAFGFVTQKDGKTVGDIDACAAARERILPWIKEYSPIGWASPDDPPICMAYGGAPEPAGQLQLNSVHGAAFGIHLKERLDAVGVECRTIWPVDPADPKAAHVVFLIERLKGKAAATAATPGLNKTTASSSRLKSTPPPALQPVAISKLPEGVKRIDLFLLMGQSNMQGTGRLPDAKTAHPRIAMMHIKTDQWYVAQHPLHFDGDPVSMEGVDRRGVGPGLAFAEAIVARESDVMVGLIPCALGGSGIGMWQKGKGTTLYDRTVQRARLALEQTPPGKARICGALWLQGESDSTEARYGAYGERLLKVVDTLRADLEQPELPFIACTIGSFLEDRTRKRRIPAGAEFDRWREINELLLGLPAKRSHTACVDARDLTTGHVGDYTHYSSEAQDVIGKRFAKQYLRLTSPNPNQQ